MNNLIGLIVNLEIDKSRLSVGFFLLILFIFSYFFKFDLLILSLIAVFVVIELYISKFISDIFDKIILIFFLLLFPLLFYNQEIISFLNFILIALVIFNIFFPNLYFKKNFLLCVLIFIHIFFSFAYIDRNLLYFIIIAAFFNDSIAFFFGKMLKGPLIIPSISPNKTWSGTIISFIFTLILIYQFDISLLLSSFLSISLFFGDIFFSYVKRKAGIKDFSNFLKGHGGFLDRLDSMFFFTIIINFIFT